MIINVKVKRKTLIHDWQILINTAWSKSFFFVHVYGVLVLLPEFVDLCFVISEIAIKIE